MPKKSSSKSAGEKKADAQTKHLDEESLASYKEAFNLFDTDKNGKIDANELHQTLHNLGQKVSMDECQEMIKDADLDSNGTMDFKEFVAMMESYFQNATEEDKQRELETAFDVFDVDGNGFISFSELRQVMINLGEELTDEDLKDMMREVDTDKDGKISRDEFKVLFFGMRSA